MRPPSLRSTAQLVAEQAADLRVVVWSPTLLEAALARCGRRGRGIPVLGRPPIEASWGEQSAKSLPTVRGWLR